RRSRMCRGRRAPSTRMCWCAVHALDLLRDEIAQHDRAVALEIVRAEEERNRALLSRLQERPPSVHVVAKLRLVATSKLRPPRGRVREPLTKRRARRHILLPRIHLERVLLHAARPQALDEESLSVGPSRGVVHAFDTNHGYRS